MLREDDKKVWNYLFPHTIRLGLEMICGISENRPVQFMMNLFDSPCEHIESEYGMEMAERDEKERNNMMYTGCTLIQKGVWICIG